MTTTQEHALTAELIYQGGSENLDDLVAVLRNSNFILLGLDRLETKGPGQQLLDTYLFAVAHSLGDLSPTAVISGLSVALDRFRRRHQDAVVHQRPAPPTSGGTPVTTSIEEHAGLTEPDDAD